MTSKPDADDPPPLPAGRARALRARLLERVADAEPGHQTIGAGDGDWQPFLEGVAIKVLHEADGVLSYLLRLAPGARVPAHRHPVDEECVVLEGALRVGSGPWIGPGGWHLARGGTLHASLSTECGATVYLRGAVPEAEHLLR